MKILKAIGLLILRIIVVLFLLTPFIFVYGLLDGLKDIFGDALDECRDAIRMK